MLRSTIVRSIRIRPTYIQPIQTRQYSIVKAATKVVFGDKGVKEVEKKEAQAENLAQDANLTAGRKAATTIDDAQNIDGSDIKKGAEKVYNKAANAAEDIDGSDIKKGAEQVYNKAANAAKDIDGSSIKQTADSINKKTGEVLSEGIKSAENLSSKATDAVKSAADTVKDTAESINKKTGEVLADGIEKTEGVSLKAKDVAEDVDKKAGDTLADGVEAGESAAKKAEAKLKVKSNTAGYKDLQDKGEKAPIEQNRPDDAM